MPVYNAEIAELFERYATLLEVDGANPFRVRAYRNAARTIAGLPRALSELVHEGADLSRLPTIGDDLAAKNEEIVETGRPGALEQIQRKVPPGVADLIALPGLGPRRVEALHRELGISDLESLRVAAQAGQVRQMRGFGARIERALLDELRRREDAHRRIRLVDAEDLAAPLVRHPGTARRREAGDRRRERAAPQGDSGRPRRSGHVPPRRRRHRSSGPLRRGRAGRLQRHHALDGAAAQWVAGGRARGPAGQPDRLDLDDHHCRIARDLGVMLAVSTDAHSASSLALMRFGIGQARRGWLGPEHVLNTRSWKALGRILSRA